MAFALSRPPEIALQEPHEIRQETARSRFLGEPRRDLAHRGYQHVALKAPALDSALQKFLRVTRSGGDMVLQYWVSRQSVLHRELY
jgi:hypothetical protein